MREPDTFLSCPEAVVMLYQGYLQRDMEKLPWDDSAAMRDSTKFRFSRFGEIKPHGILVDGFNKIIKSIKDTQLCWDTQHESHYVKL